MKNTQHRSLLYIVIAAALGGFLFGFDSGVISGCEQAIQTEFGLSGFWHGLIVSGALIGTVIGVFTAGAPSDRWGRRPTLWLMGTLFLVSAVGCAFTPASKAIGPHALGWFRFIGGLAIGGVSVVVPLYIVEISPGHLRGRLVATNQLNIVFGILISYVSNYFVARWMAVDGGWFHGMCQWLAGVFASNPMATEMVKWRVMLGMECLPILLFMALLLTIPESPRWLVRVGRKDEAEGVLSSVGYPDVPRTMVEIEESLREVAQGASARLFQRRYLKPILLAFFIAFFNQVSGINAINYYAPRIFDMIFGKGSEMASLAGTMGVGTVNLIFTVLAFFIIDKFGRRVMIIGGASLMILMHSLVAWQLSLGDKCNATLAVIGILGFIAFFACSSGAVIWVYISEVFPNAVRAKGQALGCFTHWFMCTIISWAFPVVAEKAGTWAFGFFAFMMLVQVVWAIFFMPETKGGTIEDIERRLGMVKMRGLVLVGALALAGTAVADAGDAFLLQTKNTTLALRRQHGAWNVAHYGARIASESDAAALAWDRWVGGNKYEQRRPAAYAAYGGDREHGFGFNKWGGLQVTHADGCLTLNLVGEKAEIVPDALGATHVVLKQRDRAYPFFVTQHFRALESSDVIETWVELKNGEAGAVRLGRMDSFAMDFPLLANAFRFQYATGQWAAEAQLRETCVGNGQTVSIGSRSGVRDAFGNNASFMLTVGDAATETSGRVIGGVLCWTGMWGISVQRDHCDFVEVRAGADTSAGAYVLDAGKSITLPKFAFTYSDSGKGQVSRNFHRWARDWQLPAGHKPRPVLLNSWEGSYFSFTEQVLHDMMDGVKEMGGELFVLDDGWFGTGKYARDDVHRDKVGLGDWVINPEKLPNGLAGLSDEAKKRGLKFGFWVEPEMVNTNSWLYEAHPDWVIREKNRPVNVGRGGSQTVLDYSNPAVRDNIYGQLDALYSKIPDLAYIKWDANADFFNMGSTYLDAAHQANLPFDYTVGLYDLLAKIRAKYPQVDMQACSSGGGHVDYGFLRYADEFWASDDTDARERVFIQWGESQFYPACAIAAHVTDVPNHQTGRVTPLKFRFDVAMSARLGFELHPKNMSAEDVAFAKKCVADYKRIRPTVQQGDLYRLVSPYGNSYAALMYVNGDASHAVVFLWGLARANWSDFVPPLALQGLADGKTYRVKEINTVKDKHCRVDGKALSGKALMAMGLPVRLRGDYDSAVFELTAK